MTDARPVLTWLYVPGDRPDRFDKAVASGADVVVIDWEDAVAVADKDRAREHSLSWLTERARSAETVRSVPVEVRINGTGTAWHDADLAALTTAAAVGSVASVRLPTAETADQVRAVADRLASSVTLTCLLESALGVENAYAIATASERVTRIGLGEADLRADLGVIDDDGLLWSRSRVVVAARAAGLDAPAQSVWTDLADEAGLRASCERGRQLGLLGRAAIHPRQLAPIRDAFRPRPDDIAWARRILAGVTAGDGVSVDADGRMIDGAVVRSARGVLALAERLD